MMKRSSWIGSLAAGLAATTGMRGTLAQTLRPLTLARLGPSGADWPAMASSALGMFSRYGIDLQVIAVSSTQASAQQVIAGGVDMGFCSTTQLVEAVHGGAPLKLVCNQMAKPAYSIVAQKNLKRYADLKGKTIVVGGVNDATRIFAEKMIASGGLGPADYDETYVGATTDRYAALKSGSVAAAILFPPWDFRAVGEGYTLLGTLDQVMPAFPYTGFCVRNDFAAAHPDLIVDFIKGYLRGVRWLNVPANKDRAVAILVDQTHASPEDARKTYDELVLKFKIFPATAVTPPSSFGIVIDTLAALKALSPPYPAAAAFLDNRFAEQAAAQLARET